MPAGRRGTLYAPAGRVILQPVKLAIELESEQDGRWIADIPALNVLVYGDTRDSAIRNAEKAAKEIIADRIAHGEMPSEAANAEFSVAA